MTGNHLHHLCLYLMVALATAAFVAGVHAVSALVAFDPALSPLSTLP